MPQAGESSNRGAGACIRVARGDPIPASSEQPQREEQVRIDQCNAALQTIKTDLAEKPCGACPQTAELLLRIFVYIIYDSFEERFALGTMIAMLSFACLTCGVGLAGMSTRNAGRAPMLERWSGICLLAGLCLLGAALPLFR